MTLKFIDSFDHYSSSEIVNKYDTLGGFPSIDNSAQRTGIGCLSIPPGAYVQKSIGDNQTLVVGGAFWFEVAYTNVLMAFYDITAVQCDVIVYSDNTLAVRRAGAVVLGTSTAVVELNNWNFIEVKIKVDGALLGYYEVRLNGVNILSVIFFTDSTCIWTRT